MKFLNIDSHNPAEVKELVQTVELASNAAFILNKNKPSPHLSTLELAQTSFDAKGHARNI